MSQRQSPLEYQVFDPERQEIRVVVVQPPRPRYWVHALLFLATIFTTLCIGARLQYNFQSGIAPFSQDTDLWPFNWVFQDWHRLRMGIPYCASLLAILTAHELGHYVYCVKRKVFATLPFFIPSPLLLGTFGAFIRIKSPIRTREDLFDIGIAGPIAGFVLAVPATIAALALSRPLPTPPETQLVISYPLIFRMIQNIVWPGVPLERMLLHPMAMAAWVGMFATALNLLPGGQLDGGHVIYSLWPRAHRWITFALIGILALGSRLWMGWGVWAILLLVVSGPRHPRIIPRFSGMLGAYEEPWPQLGSGRVLLAAVALAMLVLTIAPRGLNFAH